jgi:hypothetical protein
VKERGRERERERERESKRRKRRERILNMLFCLFTIYTRKNNYILSILVEMKKCLIIVKFDYFEPFAYFVGDALKRLGVLLNTSSTNA